MARSAGGRGVSRVVAFGAAMVAMVLPAMAEVGPCADLGVGIEDILGPEADATRSFYEGNVVVYTVDLIEPACCSIGLAIIMPVPDSEVGDAQCIAVTGYRGLDIKAAKTSYDDAKGLRIEVPTGGTAEDEAPVEGRVLALRLNLAEGSVKIED